MAENLHNSIPRRKKVGLWTPWGAQSVPNLDETLEKPLQAVTRGEGSEPVPFPDAADAAQPRA